MSSTSTVGIAIPRRHGGQGKLPPVAASAGTLSVSLGQASITGRRERNEDFHGCIMPSGGTLRAKGICAVVADGVGGGRGGMEAAQTAVKSLLTDYYSTPETWSVAKSVGRVLAATNSWIHAEGRRNPQLAGMATTLAAVVFKGRQYHTAHAGDSRIYLLRDGKLRRLTEDHARVSGSMPPALTRAVGLDAHLHLECHSGELAEGDRFLLVTDGVTGALDDAELSRTLFAEDDPQTACDRLVQAAYGAGSTDNITVQLICVAALPDAALDELAGAARNLPVAGKLATGDRIDGFRIEAVLHTGRMSRVYRALEVDSGRRVVLKFATREAESDLLYLERFLREEWVGLRLRSPHVVRTLRLPSRSALYYATEFIEGRPLSERLSKGGLLPVAEVVEVGTQLARAVCELHRKGVVHRDLKPENVLVTRAGRVVLIDLGAARVEGLEEAAPSPEQGPPGTPSYMAPELWVGDPGSEGSDIYAVGVTLYHLLTRRYPYGEVMPFSRPAFGDPDPVSRHRPEVPEWLMRVIERATEREAEKRYRKMTGLLYALEHPESVAAEFRPLLETNPVRFWRSAFLLMTGVAAVLLYLLARSG